VQRGRDVRRVENRASEGESGQVMPVGRLTQMSTNLPVAFAFCSCFSIPVTCTVVCGGLWDVTGR